MINTENDTRPAASLRKLVRRVQPDQHAECPEIAEMKAALNRAGYDASEADIEWAWEEHSEDWSAGWLVLDSCGGADGAVKYLLEYLMVESPNEALSNGGRTI